MLTSSVALCGDLNILTRKGCSQFAVLSRTFCKESWTFVSWAFPSEAAPALWKGAGSQAGAYLASVYGFMAEAKHPVTLHGG